MHSEPIQKPDLKTRACQKRSNHVTLKISAVKDRQPTTRRRHRHPAATNWSSSCTCSSNTPNRTKCRLLRTSVYRTRVETTVRCTSPRTMTPST